MCYTFVSYSAKKKFLTPRNELDLLGHNVSQSFRLALLELDVCRPLSDYQIPYTGNFTSLKNAHN